MSDLIERQAAIDKIEELQMSIMRSESLIDQCKFEGLGMAREVLIELPSVSTEKTGRWIDEGFYADGHSERAYRCSECDNHYIGYVGEFKYCPNCGAKMEVEE